MAKALSGEFKKTRAVQGECENSRTLIGDRCKKLDFRVNCSLRLAMGA